MLFVVWALFLLPLAYLQEELQQCTGRIVQSLLLEVGRSLDVHQVLAPLMVAQRVHGLWQALIHQVQDLQEYLQ